MPHKPIRTILLVDDHELVLQALHSYLERKGYTVLEAADGNEALLVAESFPDTIHVLVTDLVMAKMSGRELARQLMELRPQMQVIITSGFPGEVMSQQESTPQIPILPKPFPPDRLVAAIEDVLANPRREQTVAAITLPSRIPRPKRVKKAGV